MRHRSSITSPSWIPLEAVEGSTRLALEAGLAHCDEQPPDIESLETLRREDRLRFADTLSAWAELDDAGQIRDERYEAGKHDRAALCELSRDHRRTSPDRS